MSTEQGLDGSYCKHGNEYVESQYVITTSIIEGLVEYGDCIFEESDSTMGCSNNNCRINQLWSKLYKNNLQMLQRALFSCDNSTSFICVYGGSCYYCLDCG